MSEARIDTRRRLLIASLPAAAILAAILWSYGYLADQKAAARDALDADAACRQSALRIEALRMPGDSIGGKAPAQFDLAEQITQAAENAGLPDRNLEDIRSDPIRQAAVGNYREQPTRMVIRDATLRQIVTLLQGLDRPAQGLCVEMLHLSAPGESGDSKLWTAETRLLYSFPDEGKVPVR